MARIPETEIERLKSEVSVERLIEAAGIELKKAGKDLLGRCPFHEDDTASLVVTPAKNLWHCFGCGVGGGPIDWVIKKNGISFHHAVELLREGLPVVSALAAGGETVKRSTVRALPAPLSFDAADAELLRDAVAYYHERLRATPEGLAYLMARGLNHPDLVAHFRLGVADRTLGLRLPNKQRKEGQAIRARLERLGLFRASGHEHFNGSLTVPIPGLADVEGLRHAYDVRWTGQSAARPAPGRGVDGGRPVAGRDGGSAAEPHSADVSAQSGAADAKPRVHKGNGKSRSYPQPTPLAAVAG